jgi:hypothetical protein
MTSPITGEVSNSKVAAVFSLEMAARQAAEGVSAALSLGAAQVAGDHACRAASGAQDGAGKRGDLAHDRRRARQSWASLGLSWGARVFFGMRAAGIPFIVNSPVAAALGADGLRVASLG